MLLTRGRGLGLKSNNKSPIKKQERGEIESRTLGECSIYQILHSEKRQTTWELRVL